MSALRNYWKITCVNDPSGKTLGWFWSQFTDEQPVKSCLFESFEECCEAAKIHGFPEETAVETLIACPGNDKLH